MAPFNRGNQSSSNRSFGKTRFNSVRPDMYKATCARCGKICEVPFRPSGSKPVFCRDCFKNNENSDSRRSENRTFGHFNSGNRQMYDAVCAKCGKNCQIPFRPSPGKEVFCSRCFESNEGSESRRPRPEHRMFDKPSFKYNDSQRRTNDVPNYKAQFEVLNAKMDKILHLLTLTPGEIAPLESVIDEKVIKEIVDEVQEDMTKTAEKKPKKTKALTKKPIAKIEKEASPKKK